MAALHKRWHFFDKNGHHLNPLLVDDIWYADLHFTPVSVGLHEVQHVFVLEEYEDSDSGEVGYCTPRLGTNEVLRVRWNTIETEAIVFQFQIDVTGDVPLLTKIDSLDVELADGSADTTSSERRVLSSTDVSAEAIQFNFGVVGTDERTSDRILLFEVVNTATSEAIIIADFILRSEIVGEDERFRSMLENFGRKINVADFPVFRDVDINEEKVDYIKLNEKRKELLLDGHQLYSYVGSYKGLVNAIKFFGYSDLRLKEYWLNIDENSIHYGTYKHLPIAIDPKLDFPSFKGVALPSKQFKKTAKFGLYYDITRATDEHDEWGVPITESAFLFTNEEVLVKLFGLKELLKREFLPLNARIVDITGEGVYFERYRVNTWSDKVEVYEVDQERPVSFTFEPSRPFIVDLRDRRIHSCDYNSEDNLSPADLTGIDVADISHCEIKDLVLVSDVAALPYQSRYKVGAVVRLKNTSFYEGTWNQLTTSWDSLDEVTWDSVGKGEVFEIEWRVSLNSTERTYTYRKRGTSEALSDHEVILPYAGLYHVTLVLHDTLGQSYSKTEKNAIEVYTQDANMIAFFRNSPTNLRWNDAHVTWDDANFSWAAPVQTETTWDDLDIEWDTLNYLNFFNADGLDTGKVDFQIVALDREAQTVTLAGDFTQKIDRPHNVKTLLFERFEEDIPDDSYEDNVAYAAWAVPIPDKMYVFVDNWHSIVAGDRLLLHKRENYTSGFAVNIDTQTVTFSGNQTHALVPGVMFHAFEVDETSEDTGVDGWYDVKYVSYDGDTTTVYVDAEYQSMGDFDLGRIEVEYEFRNLEVIHAQPAGDDTRVQVGGLEEAAFEDIIANASDYYAKWSQYTGEFAIPVVRYEVTEDGNTTFWLDDQTGEMYNITNLFTVRMANFDLDYARSRYGVEQPFMWDSMTNVTWDDLEKTTWDSMDYHGTSYCGFTITKVAPGGTILIGDGPLFSFANDPTLTMEEAVEQLNTSDNPSVSMFQYIVRPEDPDDPDRFIQAVAKNPGSVALVPVELSEGVESEWCGHSFRTFSYPLGNMVNWQNGIASTNNPPLWNHIYRRFYENGETFPPKKLDRRYTSVTKPWQGYRIPYMWAVDGAFSWDDIVAHTRSFEVPIMTPIFAVADNCKVPGKSKFLWRIYDETNGKLLAEIAHKYLIWVPDTRGVIGVHLTVLDPNDNPSYLYRPGWITVT